MTSALFCDECGASLPAQATSCAACGQMVDASSSSPSLSSPSASPGTLQRGFLLAGRYRILSSIGQGGFAQVYKARDTSRGKRLVAIKQISLRGLSAREMIDATATYNNEIWYLSQLRHEGLPCIYDHFADGAHWYIVMEYIQGKSLEDGLKSARGGRFPVQKVITIGLSLCRVLDYLHHQPYPIIFRDLKPANIMMTHKGHLYLIDFGIARRFLRPQQRKDTAPLGSPGYAAPEQYGREQTTPQTDIYSLGATLQTLLTGKEPLELLLDGGQTNCAIPKELQELIARMLEREPGKRPRSVEEVRESLLQLGEASLGWNIKQAPAFLWHSLPLVALFLFIAFIFSWTGFFSSPLWIPCMFAVLCTIVGRSALYLHLARQEATSGLRVEEGFITVLKHLRGSILYALIPAILFYFIYGLLGPYSDFSIGDALTLGGFGLVIIIGLLSYFNWEIRSLWHHITSWRPFSTQKQMPPLQQMHVRKRP